MVVEVCTVKNAILFEIIRLCMLMLMPLVLSVYKNQNGIVSIQISISLSSDLIGIQAFPINASVMCYSLSSLLHVRYGMTFSITKSAQQTPR